MTDDYRSPAPIAPPLLTPTEAAMRAIARQSGVSFADAARAFTALSSSGLGAVRAPDRLRGDGSQEVCEKGESESPRGTPARPGNDGSVCGASRAISEIARESEPGATR